MPKKAISLLLLLSFWFSGNMVYAQSVAGAEKVEMADRLRADGKIYIVVLVLVIVLLGLIGYVVSLDRKISRLEKEAK